MATITTTTPPTDLKGWTVTVPAGWSADPGYHLRYDLLFDLRADIGGDNDSYLSCYDLYIGYGIVDWDPVVRSNWISFLKDSGAYYQNMSNSSDNLEFHITGGFDTSNPSLIQWFVDNKATFSKEEEGTQADKTNNLPAFLKDLYQGIVKKKPDASKNPQNFRGEIESIVTGITPTGSLTITENGTYPVTEKAEVIVAVPEVPEWDGSFTKGVNNLTGTTWEIPSGWKTSADQGGFAIDGEFTIENTTIIISSIHLGRYQTGYQANAITVVKAEDTTVHAITSELNPSGFKLKITGGEDVTNTYLATWLGSDGQDTTKAIISFTIDGTTYRAEHHMTWEQWVASDCNTDNYAWYQEGSFYYLSKNGDTTVAVAVYDGDYVEPADTIVSRREYVSIT